MYPNDHKSNESYRINGKEHRLNGPSSTTWYSTGQKSSEDYRINGIYHRLNGPCYTHWYENGQKSCEWYYVDDKYQNCLYWNEQGELQWVDGNSEPTT